MEKKIANLVFYKFLGEQGIMQQACIFYEDGSVKNCMYEEGLEVAEAIAKEEGTNKSSFKEMINKNRIYVLSGKEFERRFKEFVKEEPAKVYVKNTIEEMLANTTLGDLPMVRESANVIPLNKVIDFKKNVKAETKVNPTVIPNLEEEKKETKELVSLEEELENNKPEPEVKAGEEIIMDSPVKAEDERVIEIPDLDEELEIDEEEQAVETTPRKKVTKTVIIPPIGIHPEERIEFPVEDEEEVAKEEPSFFKAAENVEDLSSDDSNDSDIDLDEEIEEELDAARKKAPVEEPDNSYNEGLVKRGLRRLKNGVRKHWKAITAVVATVAIAFGLYSCNARQSKSGEISNNNIGIHSLIGDGKDNSNGGNTREIEAQKDNKKTTKSQEKLTNESFYGYTYKQLLEVTKNKTQKAEMIRIHDALVAYNDVFANAWVEDGKDVKAALSFEEMIALSQAYNQFSPQEIKAIFNGYGIRSADLENSYKTAVLQLMGAHVIESREHPVDMSGIIIDEKGKAFYQKYHELFLTAKEAEGDQKVAAVEAFYNELHKDFPISDKVREEGISHADGRAELKAYKLSVVPMVAAGEIMWQNLEIDNTLKGGVANYFLDFANFEGLTKEELLDRVAEGGNGVVYGDLDYFNDLGLCNYAEEQFDIVQQVTMSGCSNVDEENPLYEQYRDAMVDELTKAGNYVIDDEHRDLSQLDRFQDIVNWHFDITPDGYYSYRVIENTETWTRKREWTTTEKHTKYRTETTTEHKPIPQEEKEKIDREIEKENQKRKKEAEKEAEKKRKEMQDEADRKTKENQEKIKEDEKDMQEKIDNANEKIKNGETVNEDDFGDHDVDFDDEHSDNNGNLDDSVKDITTDDKNDQTGKDLPDPNKTGEEFDKKAPTNTNDPEKDYDVIIDEYEEVTNPKTNNDNGSKKEETPKQEEKKDDSKVEEQEIEEHEEAPKHEEKKEEPKQEEKHEEKKEEPKHEEKHEEPKHEEKKEEPKHEEKHEEPKHEEPKHEEKKEEPKHEEKHEEPKHEEPKHEEKKEEPKVEEQEIEEIEGEVTEHQVSQKSNEQKASEIVEAMAMVSSEEESAKVLVRA